MNTINTILNKYEHFSLSELYDAMNDVESVTEENRDDVLSIMVHIATHTVIDEIKNGFTVTTSPYIKTFELNKHKFVDYDDKFLNLIKVMYESFSKPVMAN